MVSKLISLQLVACAARKASSWRTAAISSSSPAAASLVEPGEEAGHGGAVAHVGGARAFDLGGVLDRLQRRCWDRGRARRGAGLRARWRTRQAAVWGSRRTRFLVLRSAFSRVGQCPRRRELGDCLEVGARGCVELLGRDEELGLSRLGNDREREHDGCVGDVGAADVERPGDRVAQRQQDGIVPVGLQPSSGCRRSCPERSGRRASADAHGHGVGGRSGARAAPDAIDEIARDRLQLDALGLERRLEAARSRSPRAGADRSRRSGRG